MRLPRKSNSAKLFQREGGRCEPLKAALPSASGQHAAGSESMYRSAEESPLPTIKQKVRVEPRVNYPPLVP